MGYLKFHLNIALVAMSIQKNTSQHLPSARKFQKTNNIVVLLLLVYSRFIM